MKYVNVNEIAAKWNLSERSVNYYNSVIRFMYEVTMDKLINKKYIIYY